MQKKPKNQHYNTQHLRLSLVYEWQLVSVQELVLMVNVHIHPLHLLLTHLTYSVHCLSVGDGMVPLLGQEQRYEQR